MKKILPAILIMIIAAVAATVSACTSSHEHNLIYYPSVEATCTQNGCEEYWECSECHKIFADGDATEELDAIPATEKTDHITEYLPAVPPSCTQSGRKESWHCTVCGIDFSDENCETVLQNISVPATGHIMKHIPALAATCTEAGNKEYYHCSVCGENYADESGTTLLSDVTLQPLRHDWQLQQFVKAENCISTSRYIYVCNNDSSHTYTVELEDRGEHPEYFQGVCTLCGDLMTEGLSYSETEGGYAVSGIGDFTDSILYIPHIYKGLPVVAIADEAFTNNQNITAVYLPDTVREIGMSCFEDCGSLEKVEFGEGLILIDDLAFSGSAITSVKLPDSLSVVNGFFGCSKLTSVDFGNYVTKIEASAFEYCTSLRQVYIPGTVLEIENFAFGNCTSLEYAKVYGYDLMAIGAFAFINCTSLTEADLGNTKISSVSNSLFSGCTSLEKVSLPDSVGYIWYGAFEGCSSLKNIDLPEGLRMLYSHSFYATGLEKIAIPAATTDINHNAFSYSLALREITVDEDNSVYYSSGNCIVERKTECLVVGCAGSVIPQEVKSIGTWAFGGNSALKEICIPAGVTEIDSMAFYKCSGLEKIEVAADNPVYRSEGNCLILRDGGLLLLGCINSVIPSDGSIQGIYSGAFAGCKITQIVIPQGVVSISNNAFNSCTLLSSVTLPESIVSISVYVFVDCSSLTNINYGGTVAQWQQISKADDWDIYSGNYVVICTDGSVLKDGTVQN